ncbi:MAG: hypothetical protein J7M05_09410 [Anaerolineae bacterium]|nr:hypothetical protein [Anaerolineae bacterium]
MPLPTTKLGDLEVTRFIIGGNPFSGFSHQSRQRSAEMIAWYTDERIVETLFQAEELGLTACLSRGDEHITRVLKRYWDQGGKMRWIAQTDSHAETAVAGAQYCIDHGASACYLHGGVVDHYILHKRYEDLHAFAETVKAAKIPVGIAGHLPIDFLWAEENLDLDFYMVSYYNPTSRENSPHHDPEAEEQYLESDREERVNTIQKLKRPAIHYKILAAGRLDPAQAFAYAAQHMRPFDAVCVGIYTKDDPEMLAKDVQLFLNALRAVGQYP